MSNEIPTDVMKKMREYIAGKDPDNTGRIVFTSYVYPKQILVQYRIGSRVENYYFDRRGNSESL